MAKPRVFVSSTHYDLKHIRASLDLFINSLGFESILSEKGNVPYIPELPPDESCYREAEQSDIFVLLIGGRYGSEVNRGSKSKVKRQFNDRYDSITKKEFESAILGGMPTYILIESRVLTEYDTFQLNRDKADISYAHVDSVNIFLLIESILAMPRRNPYHTFEKYEDIENWLRDQWSGLFRELLKNQIEQQQITTIKDEVEQLKEQNNTLRNLIQGFMMKPKEEYEALIEGEEKRLEEVRYQNQKESLNLNKWIEHISMKCGKGFDEVLTATRESTDLEDYLRRITSTQKQYRDLKSSLAGSYGARRDLNETRDIVGAPHFKYPEKFELGTQDEP